MQELLQKDFKMPAAVVAHSSVRRERSSLSALARTSLESHPHFRGRLNDVAIAQDGRTLVITGKLPSFYLKQLVQETVRHVPGVQSVHNMIDVVNSEGISSVRG